MKKHINSLVAALTLVVSTNIQAESDSIWFENNFTLVRTVQLEDSVFSDKSGIIYRNNSSGNCYFMFSGGKQGSFSQVPCEDFLKTNNLEKIVLEYKKTFE